MPIHPVSQIYQDTIQHSTRLYNFSFLRKKNDTASLFRPFMNVFIPHHKLAHSVFIHIFHQIQMDTFLGTQLTSSSTKSPFLCIYNTDFNFFYLHRDTSNCAFITLAAAKIHPNFTIYSTMNKEKKKINFAYKRRSMFPPTFHTLNILV